MPRKHRLLSPTKADRFPDHWDFTAFDIESPVGSWRVDEPIAAIVAAGHDWIHDRAGIAVGDPVRFASWRQAAVYAADEAHGWAWMMWRNNPKADLHFRSNLAAFERLSLFMREIHRAIPQRLHKDREGNLISSLSEKMASFLPDLDEYVSLRRERDGNQKHQPNRDYLSEFFVRAMRDMWEKRVGQPPPRLGGKLLVEYSAAAWGDVGFPIVTDQPTPDWMAGRFKAVCPAKS